MNTSPNGIKLLIAAIATLVVGVLVYSFTQTPGSTEPSVVQAPFESIEGCYVMSRSKDVYTLNVQSQQESTIRGTLAYKNFQMDSSSGTFEGAYQNNTLLGYYSFTAEGEDSVRQVIFKKIDSSFVQGFGPAETVGGREVFTDLSEISYDPAFTFISERCQ